jgi:hypothetical protein
MSSRKIEGRVELQSRISVRALFVGSTVTLVVLGLLLALGGALGLLPSSSALDAQSVRDAGAGLVAWAALSWIVAASIGGFVSAVTARATDRRDGLLHGLATWATACAVAGVASCAWFMSATSTGLASRDLASVFWTRGTFGSFFVADLLALIAALVGGSLGVRSENRISGGAEVKPEERAPQPPVGVHPTPHPT